MAGVSDSRCGRRGCYSGWLSKVKSEDAKRRLPGMSNMRWFTIDFDNQVMSYSHSKGGKVASGLICFKSILGAALVSTEAEAQKLRRSLSGTLLRRMLSGPEVPMACRFTLHLQERTLRLSAQSAVVALWWVDMFNAACMLGLNMRAYDCQSLGDGGLNHKFQLAARQLKRSFTPSEYSQASQSTTEPQSVADASDGGEVACSSEAESQPEPSSVEPSRCDTTGHATLCNVPPTSVKHSQCLGSCPGYASRKAYQGHDTGGAMTIVSQRSHRNFAVAGDELSTCTTYDATETRPQAADAHQNDHDRDEAEPVERNSSMINSGKDKCVEIEKPDVGGKIGITRASEPSRDDGTSSTNSKCHPPIAQMLVRLGGGQVSELIGSESSVARAVATFNGKQTVGKGSASLQRKVHRSASQPSSKMSTEQRIAADLALLNWAPNTRHHKTLDANGAGSKRRSS